MAKESPELFAHKEWLGQIQQVGLVVSPFVLVKRGVGIDRQRGLEIQTRITTLATEDENGDYAIADFATFAREMLEWPPEVLAEPDASVSVSLPEHDDVLSPTFVLVNVASGFSRTILVSVVEGAFDTLPEDHKGWRATPHARLERLLRETEIPIGLLYNGRALRLIYAPRGESSGHLTFKLKDLLHTQGRPMAAALDALLHADHFNGVHPDERRLPALLKESRKFQNEVSTKLSGQVLEALWELLRGFQRANEESGGRLLAEVLREDKNDVYGGLLSTLMRLVFILYAEDRGLMPQGEVYQNHYSLFGLFKRLQDDDANHPDTMDARFGAWGQMLALFRLVHDGGGHGDLRFPARHGRLFDPDSYPFLEGRPAGSHRSTAEIVHPPHVSDGAVFRILRNLLILDGERLSYRALDVEQIGSVYEAMMGFALRQAAGPAIAVLPKHIVFDIRELLDQEPKARAKWLQEQAEAKLTGDAIAKAKTVDDVVAALGRRVSPHTPHVLKAGDIYLQPTEERRRSGSHYTPRSLTAPIVATTFRPIFERLGDQATPEQILDLKVCDPAMGSGAFLVEACRLLADRLVRAWETHRQTPKVPDDEDVVTYARRLVAERCLYGVDKNIFAVDLAKLSLWLATLAREHPFTFLDHSLRNGDSLVGLSREQIACLNWEVKGQLPLLRGVIDARVATAQRLREQIQGMATSDDVPEKTRLLQEANEAIDDVRRIGDAIVSAFFERDKLQDRHALRVKSAADVEHWLSNPSEPFRTSQGYSDRSCFHWEIEFPEVFTRANAGFDAFVGNPPFMGGMKISTVLGSNYLDILNTAFQDAGNRADLVAYFFRRAFMLVRSDGCLGLVATNTISQGDTRTAGLHSICRTGGVIYSAWRRFPWPGLAAVIVSVVWIIRGQNRGRFELDGLRVETITPYLFGSGGHENPSPLQENRDKSYKGSVVLGMGFTFGDSDATGTATPVSRMREILTEQPEAQRYVEPYLGAEDFVRSPTHKAERFIINFGDLSLEDASRFPSLLEIVETKVKPGRLAQKREVYKARWWQFAEKQLELYRRLEQLNRVLVIPEVCPQFSVGFVPTGQVFAQTLYVLLFDTFAAFSILQSRLHESWSRCFGSSMKDDLRYTPSDCFDTFPFPTGWESNRSIESAGSHYHDSRAEVLVGRNEGLTKVYNYFHDRDEHDAGIVKLRDLHAAMDRAVLDAYGWTDIQPTCEFILDYVDEEDDEPGKASKKKKPWRYRWPDEIRDEVLGRLLELNAKRAAEEQAMKTAPRLVF
ncbi:MAG: N-6 DNA methylase [Acidobacteriota bacterium]|nr:N-6 DNA methylase [Acidobacteriota bacterium]